MSLSFLARSPRWVAVDKPPGLAVIPTRTGAKDDCLLAQVEAAIGARVWVVHRIDKDTSGAVLFALDAPTHRALSMAFEAGQVKKRYLALVEGRLESARTVDAPITAGRKGKMRVAREGEQGKASQTRLRALELFPSASYVEAEPLTGRTHQIRVHLQHAGHPLLADPLYGKPPPVEVNGVTVARTPLHAARVELTLGAEKIAVDSPLPEDFQRLLNALR